MSKVFSIVLWPVGASVLGALIWNVIVAWYDSKKLEEGYVSILWGLYRFKGRAAALEAPGEGWGETFRLDVPAGDYRNSKEEWIPLRMDRPWRVRYGARAKLATEKGHFTIRVYPRKPGSRRTEEEGREIARLGAGAFKLRRRTRTHTETGDFLLHVDAQTVWYAVTIEEREERTHEAVLNQGNEVPQPEVPEQADPLTDEEKKRYMELLQLFNRDDLVAHDAHICSVRRLTRAVDDFSIDDDSVKVHLAFLSYMNRRVIGWFPQSC